MCVESWARGEVSCKIGPSSPAPPTLKFPYILTRSREYYTCFKGVCLPMIYFSQTLTSENSRHRGRDFTPRSLNTQKRRTTCPTVTDQDFRVLDSLRGKTGQGQEAPKKHFTRILDSSLSLYSRRLGVVLMYVEGK